MNIEHSKTIPIVDILDKLEFKPEKTDAHKAVFKSPFRNEERASFKVDLKKNLWVDFGEQGPKGKPLGGDALAFVCKWLSHTGNGSTVPDGLRWLKNMFEFQRIAPIQEDEQDNDPNAPTLKLIEDKPITEKALVEYLASRGIPIEYAMPYLREVHIRNRNTKNRFYALGLKNEDDGYEVRNSYFKGCVGPKNVTMIRGKIAKPDELLIVEGMMDFLSILVSEGKQVLDGHTMILNSVTNLEKATAFIANYGYKTVLSYMHNDNAGRHAIKNLDDYFKTQEEIVHQPMNDFYSGYKDVNEWHVDQLKLSK